MADLQSRWAALELPTTPRTPFTTPSWNLLWWKHLRRRRNLIEDELFVHTVSQGERLIAVAPMMLTHVPARGPLRTRKLQFFGADPNITELRGLVCAADSQAIAVQALMREFLGRQSEWDWLEWCGIRAGSTAEAWLGEIPELRWTRQVPDYYLVLPDSWEEFRASRGRNIKESLRKCYNSLKRAGHGFEFRRSASAGETVHALERFFELHRARAIAFAHARHPDYFSRREAREFLLEYAQSALPYGRLCVFELLIGSKVVAARLGFALGDELYLYYSGFDPDWGKFSVMTTLVAETIKWAIGAGFARVNLSTGDDQSKQRWHPASVTYRNAVQIGPRWRSKVAHRLYQQHAYRPR